ncbi:MAG: phosphate/phosphite/phosphonate ABC transporter substrate-binding protein [Synechococcus sp.]
MVRRKTFVLGTIAVLGSSVLLNQYASESFANPEGPDTLRFAVTDVVGLEELQRDFGPFKAALEDVTGKPVEFFPVADRAAAAVALQTDAVDVVLAGPAEYVVLRARTNAEPLVGITRPKYRSVIAVPAEASIDSLDQLPGNTLALSDIGSTSGHLGPSVILAEAGIDPLSDLDVLMLGDADLQALKNGDVDAWGGSLIDYERFIESEGASADEYPIIETGDMLPNDVFMASDDLAPEYIDLLVEQMYEGQSQLIEAIVSVSSNAKYIGSEIVPAEDEDYDSIRLAYQAVGVEEFSEFIGE